LTNTARELGSVTLRGHLSNSWTLVPPCQSDFSISIHFI